MIVTSKEQPVFAKWSSWRKTIYFIAFGKEKIYINRVVV